MAPRGDLVRSQLGGLFLTGVEEHPPLQYLQVSQHGPGELIALVAVLHQRLGDDPLEFTGRVAYVSRERRGLSVEYRDHHVRRRLALERRAPGDHLVQHDAETENVRA